MKRRSDAWPHANASPARQGVGRLAAAGVGRADRLRPPLAWRDRPAGKHALVRRGQHARGVARLPELGGCEGRCGAQQVGQARAGTVPGTASVSGGHTLKRRLRSKV